MSARRHDQPEVITDAAPSFDEEQAHRRRTYLVIMIVHIVGFALSYPLYLWQPWAGAVTVVATGALPWVAVLLANAPPPRPTHRVGSPQRPRPRSVQPPAPADLRPGGRRSPAAGSATGRRSRR